MVEPFDDHPASDLFNQAKGLEGPFVKIVAEETTISKFAPGADDDLRESGIVAGGRP